MATTRMTTVKALDYVLNLSETISDFPADVREKLEHMKEQAAKRSSAERKPSKSQLANDAIRVDIMKFLRESNEPRRVSEIAAAIPELNGASSQRISGLMRTLFLNGQVDKFVDKRITYYKVMEGV